MDTSETIVINTSTFPMFIRKSPSIGCLLGYIAVPPGHPWHGLGYDFISASVHGGLTYADTANHFGEEAPQGSWVLGFDCGHAGDEMPTLGVRGILRDQNYVRNELDSLHEQAVAAAS